MLVTLLPYLEEKHQIDLMKSEYGELAAFLTNTTGTTHFIFTPVQRAAFLNRLEPKSFSEEAMRQYFNEFNATNEQEIGRAMLDGVSAARLSQIDQPPFGGTVVTKPYCCARGLVDSQAAGCIPSTAPNARLTRHLTVCPLSKKRLA